MQHAAGNLTRRTPKQRRSRQTIDLVLQAVELVVKRHGVEAITTNRIAEVAGVSVGSLYQYFPSKQAIFATLHDRHVDEVRLVIEKTSSDCAKASFENFIRELMQGLLSAHEENAELHDVVASAVPQSASGFRNALQRSFGHAMERAPDPERYSLDECHRMLFVLPRMVESLVHAGAGNLLSRNNAKSEAMRAVLGYVNSFEVGPSNYS